MPRLALNWLHLAALWALAIGQPLLEILAENADFLVARGNAWPDAPLVAIGIILVPPTLMVGFEALLGSWPDVQRWAHGGLIGLLTASLAVQVLKEELDPTSLAPFALAVLAGVLLMFVYLRTRFVSSLFTVLSPAPLVVLVWFLGLSPVASFAWPHDPEDASEPARTVPVVVVILDEISTASIMDGQHIDGARFPNFAELAERSTWYRNATTVADSTVHAVPAIFTGHLKADEERATAQNHPPSLFELAGDSWEFNVHEADTSLCPNDLCPGAKDTWLERSIQLVRDLGYIERKRLLPGKPPVELLAVRQLTNDRDTKFRDWIRSIRGGRTINALHIELPHVPYQYTSDGRRYTDSKAPLPGVVAERWTKDAALVTEGYRRYVEQTRFTDRLVGEMMDRLDRTGVWDDALVVLTADHGVAFVPNKSRRTIVRATAGEIAGVPMFVKVPGQTRGRTDDSAARSIDVLPTIGDYLDADWALAGRSLRRAPARSDIDVVARFGPDVSMPLVDFAAMRDRAVARLASMRQTARAAPR